MDKIIEILAKKLGVSPEKLKKAIRNGNINEIADDMRKEDHEQLKSVMNNAELREKLINSENAAEIIKKMKKGD